MWDSKPHLLIVEGWFEVDTWDLHSENQPHSVAGGVDHNLRITSYWTKGKWAEAHCFRASKSVAQGQRSVVCALLVTWQLQRTLRLCKDQLILVCQGFFPSVSTPRDLPVPSKLKQLVTLLRKSFLKSHAQFQLPEGNSGKKKRAS